MAFWLFREQEVETAVVEVGLGGRLDATNVVRPTLTVITSIDLDHQAWLGDTIEQIAGEKAGILKPGVPAVFAKQRADVQVVLDARARDLGISVIRAADSLIKDVTTGDRSSRFVLDGHGEIVCPLAGDHQIDNAVTAALALKQLGVSSIGIADAFWPGRLEHISPNPDVILDGAHNPAGAAALARYLQQHYPQRKLWLVFGAMRDKAVSDLGGILFPLASQIVFTAPALARARPPAELAEQWGRGRTADNVVEALRLIAAEVSSEDVIVITGSLYLVGEARTASYNRKIWPFSGAWA